MLPSVVASEIRESIRRFLRATFPMTTVGFRRDDGRTMLDDFLEDEVEVFRGPYLNIGLPFRLAESDAASLFDHLELPFRPYQHQFRAFERLCGTSRRSSLIATGTGSGKTECFFYPILDHCATHRGRGIKAVIVYPMNALATDQSRRFAREIWSRQDTRGRVSVGLYIGDSDGSSTGSMGADHVITSKEELQKHPPDILLTNYKMLDFLLLRPKDQPLWQFNEPGRLQFLVVDELHTFDGAQGTDLACLIRRLRDRFDPDEELTCIGTSATIGGERARDDLLAYAGKVFATEFDVDAVIREDRLHPDEFLGDEPLSYTNWPQRVVRIRPEHYASADEYLRAVALAWFGNADAPELSSTDSAVAKRARFELGQCLRRCLAFRELLEHAESVTDVSYVLAEWQQRLRTDRITASRLLDSLVALVSAARVPAGGDPQDGTDKALPFVQVRVQLWLRELTRLVSSVTPEPVLKFHDDLTDPDRDLHLPTIHCRECHGTGWATVKQAGEDRLESDVQEIYKAHFGRHPDSTLLFPLDGPPPEVSKGIDCQICPQCARASLNGSAAACPSCDRQGERLRVWMPDMQRTVQREEMNQQRTHHDCPFCGAREGLSLIGSRAASLSSVMIGQLFSSPHNDHNKLIAFSDSVQDAAHRAGFFGARTYTTAVRMAIAQFLANQGEGLTLADVAAEVPRYWIEHCGDSEHFASMFIAPNMEWLQDYEALREHGRLPAGSDLSELVSKRLNWEVIQGFGLRARIGRTLERTFSAAVGVDLDGLRQTAERVRTRLSGELEQLREVETSAVLRYLLGMFWRMRIQGAFYHQFLDAYIRDRGRPYTLTNNKFMPNYGRISRPPALVSLGRISESFESLHREGSSWHYTWFNKVLAGDDDVLASAEYRQAVEITIRELNLASYLVEKDVNGEPVWGLDPAQWICTSSVTGLACKACGHRIQVPTEEANVWADICCLRATCNGLYGQENGPVVEAPYRRGEVKRLVPAEHTGLLDGQTRHALEQSFMNGTAPWDVNLLSATPTLEMGIDIGDLSSVLLCSVPPAQANYVQRVGRAGRRDGNALTLTVANGHNHDLYFYADPLEMIAGEIRPPGVFLEATSVLERQLIAFCMDRWAASGVDEKAIPGTMRDVLNGLDHGDERDRFPFNLLDFVASHRGDIFRRFQSMFPDLGEESQEHLEKFLFGTDGQATLGYRLSNRLHQLLEERKAYSERIDRLKRRKDELEAQPEDDRTVAELEEVLAERGALMQLRRRMNATPTFNFLTDEGLLPNYAFPEEGVTLQSIIIRRRSRQERSDGSNERAYDKLNFQMQRPAQSAISELAPHNRFYAVGRQVEIDQVDLKLSTANTWRLCDRCHHVENIDENGDPHSVCPRCGSAQWADAGQKRQMLRLRHVYASADDRASRIGDDSDQRTPAFFNRQMLVDVPANTTGMAYRLKTDQLPFGFEYIPRVEMREINFGQPEAHEEPTVVAGETMPRPGFQLCRHCGKVRQQGGRRRRGFEHAYDCKLRRPDANATEEDYFDSLYLFRELGSEAVRILLPLSEVGAAGRRMYSLIAALNLGLRQYFRGNVDHIRATYYSEPEGGGSNRRHYIVLYDSVPGGTGYLKELLRSPENLLDLLRRAYTVLIECPCAEDPDRDGCYQCILAYREARRMGEISRQSAADLLGKILEESENIEEIEGLSSIDLNTLLESELEQRFVQALTNAGPGITFTPEMVNNKPGAFISVTVSGSTGGTGTATAWKLEPQVNLGPAQGVAIQSKPDFVLWPVRAGKGVHPVAVYVDGFQYHYNTLADDTLKRQAVIDSGRFRVWSLGWHDLPISGQKVINPAQDLLGSGQQPAMQTTFSKLAPTGGWRPYPEYHALIAQGGFQWLLCYLQGGEAGLSELSHAALSRAMGWLDARTVRDPELRQEVLGEITNITPETVHRIVQDAESSDSFALGGLLESLGHGAMPVRTITGLPLSAMKAAEEDDVVPLVRQMAIALVVDDTQAVADKTYEQIWYRFWGAANLLQFVGRCALVASSGLKQGLYQVLTETWAPPDAAADEAETDETEAAWQEVTDLSVQPEVVEFLQQAGVDVPVVGHDVQDTDGRVIAEADLAWPEQRVAIVPTDAIEDVEILERLEWQVFRGLEQAREMELDELGIRGNPAYQQRESGA